MKKIRRILSIGLMLAMILVLVAPIAIQAATPVCTYEVYGKEISPGIAIKHNDTRYGATFIGIGQGTVPAATWSASINYQPIALVFQETNTVNSGTCTVNSLQSNHPGSLKGKIDSGGTVYWYSQKKNGEVAKAQIHISMTFGSSGTGAYAGITSGSFDGILDHTTIIPTITGNWILYK
jgi:hypothetical protein